MIQGSDMEHRQQWGNSSPNHQRLYDEESAGCAAGDGTGAGASSSDNPFDIPSKNVPPERLKRWRVRFFFCCVFSFHFLLIHHTCLLHLLASSINCCNLQILLYFFLSK